MNKTSYFRSLKSPRSGLGLSLAILMLSTMPAAAAMEYYLQPGDVIEISVAGIPELRQRVTVQIDGSISYPVAGTLMVAGLKSSELRGRIQAALASKIYRLRTATGQELAITMEPEEIAASIVEYQPIYVRGSVTRPGEQPYRPSMTVRQALASASGMAIAPTQANNAAAAASDLRSDYTSTWLDLAKEQARIVRLKNELGEKAEPDGTTLPPPPVSETEVAQIANVETDYSTTRQTAHDREAKFIQESIKMADAQIDVLTEQQEKESQGVEADILDLQRATDLLNKGSLTNTRVTEARRAVLMSATRKLQTNAELMHVRNQRNELARQLVKLDEQRKIDLLQELQDTNVKVGSLRAKLQSIQEKLQFSGAALPLSADAFTNSKITIFRKGRNNRERIVADEDTELLPGDVIDIRQGSINVGVLGREGTACQPDCM